MFFSKKFLFVTLFSTLAFCTAFSAESSVEKKDKKLKSKYYNKKDFEIAKKAISLMEKKKWETAIKLSKKAKDKSIYNFIVWRYLLWFGEITSWFMDKS